MGKANATAALTLHGTFRAGRNTHIFVSLTYAMKQKQENTEGVYALQYRVSPL